MTLARAVAFLALLVGPVDPAFAQAPAERAPPREEQVAPGPGPQERGSLDSAVVRARLLDDLFARLKAAATAQEADAVDDAIEAIWARTGSPTVDLLMGWAVEELARRNAGRALDYLDGVLVLDPDHAEAYYRRGQLHFSRRDYAKAMADLERALALEPRHYGALVGIGTMLRDLRRDRPALAAFRAALAIHPHHQAAKRGVEALAARVDGRDA
jgi:tetratricopeptide (TPR) repeat protein